MKDVPLHDIILMMKLELLNITEKKQTQFEKNDICSVEDLLNRFPKKYYDGTSPVKFSELIEKQTCITEGVVVGVNNGYSVFSVWLKDAEGKLLKVAFFHMDFVADRIYKGCTLTVLGTPRMDSYDNCIAITNPTQFAVNSDKLHTIIPVYKKIKGMSEEYYQACIDKALAIYKPADFLSGDMLIQNELCTLKAAYRNIHRPTCKDDIVMAKKRFVFNDLFQLNLMLEYKKDNSKLEHSHAFTGAKLMSSYYKTLPFDLTDGQKDVVRRLYNEGKSKHKINALLQADVGYGKTEIAKVLSLFTVESGMQVVVMAPTAVLATQHYRDFSESFKDLGVNVSLLISGIKATERRKTLKAIKDGTAQIIVGTHSCISKDVEYKDLGLMIIDEEHKFGVAQREKLKEKAKEGIHSLSMSATPIPRTLAMAMFGDDTEILEIKTAPAFKKPVETHLVKTEEDSFKKLLGELQAGHQAYIVCPAIGDEDDDDNGIDKNGVVGKHYDELLKPYGYKVGVLDGKMKKTDLEKTIQDFVSNKIQVLVSTTVVEVGVNVPNATVIILKNAERYGLAQIHQLRGRVGRGSAQGYCFLESTNEKAYERLSVVEDSNDGFYIAEQDMKYRGIGTITDTQQKGKNPLFETLLEHLSYNTEVKAVVQEACKDAETRKYYRYYFEDIVKQYGESLG